MPLNLDKTLLSPKGKAKARAIQSMMPFKMFVPNRPQFDLIRAIGTLVPQKRIFLITSGNGTGKSSCIINIILGIVFGNRNIYRDIIDEDTHEHLSGFFDFPFYNSPSDVKKIWIVANADALKSIQDEFNVWLPPEIIDTHREGKTFIGRYSINGWEIIFKSTDQEPETFESQNVFAVFCDEYVPQQIFSACISRLRRGGFICMTATPVFESGWIVDEIIDKVELGSDKWHQTVGVHTNCEETAGMWDLGVFGKQYKGVLKQANVDFVLRNCDPDEIDARRDGIPKRLSGLVYKTYDRDLHFVNVNHLPSHSGDYSWRFILDPHDRRPPAALWVRIDQWGRRSYIREFPCPSDSLYPNRMFHEIKNADPYTITDFARHFVEIFNELKIPLNRTECIIDPNFGKKPNRSSGLMCFEEYQKAFEDAGYPISFHTNVNDDIASRHKAVKEALKPSSDGDVRLQIDKSCLNTDHSMRRYSYDSWTGKTADKRGIKEAVIDKDKDFCDLVGYDMMLPFTWVEPEQQLDYHSRIDYEYSQPGYIQRPQGV